MAPKKRAWGIAHPMVRFVMGRFERFNIGDIRYNLKMGANNV